MIINGIKIESPRTEKVNDFHLEYPASLNR